MWFGNIEYDINFNRISPNMALTTEHFMFQEMSPKNQIHIERQIWMGNWILFCYYMWNENVDFELARYFVEYECNITHTKLRLSMNVVVEITQSNNNDKVDRFAEPSWGRTLHRTVSNRCTLECQLSLKRGFVNYTQHIKTNRECWCWAGNSLHYSQKCTIFIR